MLTILLEVKSNDPNRIHIDFYNPATSDFKKFPRSENGVGKAIESLSILANNTKWVEDWRFVVYEGKYHYSKKEMKPMFILDSKGNAISA